MARYRWRWTFEDRLDEFNAAIGKGLSGGSFGADEASLLLRLPAFNPAGMVRGELGDAAGRGRDLKRVRQTVLKAGARVVEHSGRVYVDVVRAAGVLWDRLLAPIRRLWRTEVRGRPRASAGQAGSAPAALVGAAATCASVPRAVGVIPRTTRTGRLTSRPTSPSQARRACGDTRTVWPEGQPGLVPPLTARTRP